MTPEKMNYLSSGTKKNTEKTERKKKKQVKKYDEIKFCFNYNLLKTWLAQLTVQYSLYHYDTTTDVQLNSSGKKNYTETMEKTLSLMQELAP